MHSSKEYAQQGNLDPGVQERLQAMEKAVLSMTLKTTPPTRAGSQPQEPSGKTCRLWNANQCTFHQCQHTHSCSRCGGSHPVLLGSTAHQRSHLASTVDGQGHPSHVMGGRSYHDPHRGSTETCTAPNPDGWSKVGYSQFSKIYPIEGQLNVG